MSRSTKPLEIGDGLIDSKMCGRHAEAIRRLDDWQRAQNGALLRVETKVDGLKITLMTLLGGLVVNLLLMLANLLFK